MAVRKAGIVLLATHPGYSGTSLNPLQLQVQSASPMPCRTSTQPRSMRMNARELAFYFLMRRKNSCYCQSLNMAQHLQQGRKLSEAMIRALFMLFFAKSQHLCSGSPSLPSLGLFVRISASDDVLEFHTASAEHKRLRPGGLCSST